MPSSSFQQVHRYATVLAYTPELQITVVLISSPLALLVALWGMTSDLALEAMRQNKRQAQKSMRSKMLQGEA